MSEQPRTRQELYDTIRYKGKQEFILDEMIRLGFWPEKGEIPEDPADEIRRSGKIRKELQQLRQENARLYDKKAQLKQRLAESRRKQQENKEKRERERLEKTKAWQERKQREIIYLGEEVSGGLDRSEYNIERLKSHSLPILTNAEEMAIAMEITIGELRFLAFNRKTSPISHYIRFKIPKKTGGERLISAPMPRLKTVQYWILNNVLEKIAIHKAVHGFRRDRSIVTNATPHVGADVVINFDLKDFFPSISYKRVKGVFCSFGYSEAVATIFALLCSEAETEKVELDGKIYYVAQGDRHLPQGSPASPVITNIICRRLDKRLTEMAEEIGFKYTRYADDLTFSASGDNLRHICNIMRRTRSIVTHEGFTINESKTRILRGKSSQLEVTGIVVNEHLNLDKKDLKRFRAVLYQIEKDGLKGKKWGNSHELISAIQGYANFVAMVHPKKGEEFKAQVRRIREKFCNQK